MLPLRDALARKLIGMYPFRNGQGRIIDHTFLGRMQFDAGEVTVPTSDGFDISVLPNDHIGRHLVLTGKFDRTNVEVLLSLAKPDDRIVDVGANIGYVSCVLLARLPGCRVACVEPQPDIFALLEKNVRRVGEGRATCIRAAVSDHMGDAAMQVDFANRGASALLAEGARATDVASKSVITVPLVNGEALMKQSGLDRIDLIKIDVEGHELQVLATLAPLIEKFRPRGVLFEHRDPFDPASPIRRLFDPIGYEIRGIVKSLNGWTLRRVAESLSGQRRPHDYLATPRP